MSFFKNLFSKDEPFVPTPSQQVPGLEPIVVHVVESLFSNKKDQKQVFKDLIEKSEVSGCNTLVLLSLLFLGEGKMEEHKRMMDMIKVNIKGTDTGFFIRPLAKVNLM